MQTYSIEHIKLFPQSQHQIRFRNTWQLQTSIDLLFEGLVSARLLLLKN